MIIALLAAGMLATVLVHLLAQRRRAPLAFGDTRFLVPVQLRQRQVRRLQQILLLVLRLALLGMIGAWLSIPQSAQSRLAGPGDTWQSPRIAGAEDAEPALLWLHQERPAQASIADHWQEGVTAAPALLETRIQSVAVDAPQWQGIISLLLPQDHPQRDNLATALAAIDASGAMNLNVCGADCAGADIAFVADVGSKSTARWQVQLEPSEDDWSLHPMGPNRYRLGLPTIAGDAYAWRLQQLLHQLLSQRQPPASDAGTALSQDWQALYPLLILLLWVAERLIASGRRS